MDIQLTVNIGSEGLKELADALRLAIMEAEVKHQNQDAGIPISSVSQTVGVAPMQPVNQTAAPAQMQQPVQQSLSQSMPTQQSVQTTAHEYNLGDLSSAAMQLMDKGMQTQLQELLAGYGVAALPELPKEQYGNFATALRGMGAQI